VVTHVHITTPNCSHTCAYNYTTVVTHVHITTQL